MWQPVYRQSGFASRSEVTEETESTGKWLVPIALDDLDGLWERIVVAAASGELPAAKLSSPLLDAILGHHLACVYSPDSSREEAASVLGKLRSLGVTGPLSYKTDLATTQGRDDKLWVSIDVEAEAAPMPGMP